MLVLRSLRFWSVNCVATRVLILSHLDSPPFPLQVTWCTWCPAGCSITSSVSLRSSLSRPQPPHTLQTHLSPIRLQTSCRTTPHPKVFHLWPPVNLTQDIEVGPQVGNSPRFISVPSTTVSSPGVVKIVVRQAAGKEGGPVPTLAVAPSPRLAPQAPPPSLHPHTNTTPVRSTALLQIAPRAPGPGPGPATAHYTIAPLRPPSSTPNQPQPTRPVLKVVQPPPSSIEQPGETTC